MDKHLIKNISELLIWEQANVVMFPVTTLLSVYF